jgi:hypothetical protein
MMRSVRKIVRPYNFGGSNRQPNLRWPPHEMPHGYAAAGIEVTRQHMALTEIDGEAEPGRPSRDLGQVTTAHQWWRCRESNPGPLLRTIVFYGRIL